MKSSKTDYTNQPIDARDITNLFEENTVFGKVGYNTVFGKVGYNTVFGKVGYNTVFGKVGYNTVLIRGCGRGCFVPFWGNFYHENKKGQTNT